MWARRFEESGHTVQQTHSYAVAYGCAASASRVCVAWSGDLLSAFRVDQDRAVCLFGIRPALGILSGERLEELAKQVCEDLGTPVVYFPHMGHETARRAHGRFALWERLPNSVLDWSDRGATLCKRVRERYGSRSQRQWSRFERSGLTVRTALGDAAISAVDWIEGRSWKATCQQSMHHRDNQLELYSALIKNNLVQLDVAYDGLKPVAYRMDARVGDTVMCLKWSFDEEYRRLSPGFYMLTVGLVERWARTDVSCIDLSGSPDSLKTLVRTDVSPRFDLAWPVGRAASKIRIERERHDARLRTNYEAGRGIRHAYLECDRE